MLRQSKHAFFVTVTRQTARNRNRLDKFVFILHKIADNES